MLQGRRMKPGDRVTVTIRRNNESGWACEALVSGYLVQRQYYGYTKREAVTLFRASVTRVTDRDKQAG